MSKTSSSKRANLLKTKTIIDALSESSDDGVNNGLGIRLDPDDKPDQDHCDHNTSITENNDDVTGEPKHVDKESAKYKAALKLTNKILTNIGKPEIDDLRQFVDIDRLDIIKDVNRTSLKEMEREYFKHFSKDRCGYYKKTSAVVLNCLRGMARELGLNCCLEKKDIHKVIDGLNFRRTYSLYSIK